MKRDRDYARYERFGVDARDLQMWGPTLDTIVAHIGVSNRPEAEQREAVLAAVAQKRLFPLELDVLRKAGWS